MPLRIPQRGCESCRDGEVWWREKSDTPGSLGDHLSVPMKKNSGFSNSRQPRGRQQRLVC
jgi:hypothetical protein